MAMAKPIIATRVGGNPELIENKVSGILIPPGNPEAMADSILQIMKNRETTVKMGLAARKRAVDKFNIDDNVKKIEGIYSDLINNSDAKTQAGK
jgi:glycosyltransferase involved in cell wall biosynthesis